MKKLWLLILLLCSMVTLSAQKVDPVVMEIGDKKITRSELQYAYLKNNASSYNERRKTVEEYAELYRRFQLKVAAAERLGLDTVKAFVSEYKNYRAQLVLPYLTDKHAEDSLYHEAYNRMKEDVQVQHILLRLPANYTAKDTLAVYQQAMDIRKRAQKEDFSKLAQEVMDETVNGQPDGYLGWFTGGMAVYPLENAIYNTPVGSVSKPIRVGNAYYLIKVLDRAKAHGKIRCAHIFVRCEENMSAEEQRRAYDKIVKAQNELKGGKSFETVANEMSEDPRSATIGGDVSWFGVGMMVREFETAAFNLKAIGDVSEPVKTAFGWHIIKLLDRKGIDSFEDQKDNIRKMMEYDGRTMIVQQYLVEKLKKEYNFLFDKNSWSRLVTALNGLKVNTKDYDFKVKTLTSTLATFSNRSLTQKDFAAYLKRVTPEKNALNKDEMQAHWNRFVAQEILAYEDSQLEGKYPELRYLLKEYHDGILLFNVSSHEVWDKATQDTAGLSKFFKEHQGDYVWKEPHFKGRICCCKDKQTGKIVKRLLETAPKDSINSYLSTRINLDTTKYVETIIGLWKQGENKVIDRYVFKQNVPDDPTLPKELPFVFTYGNVIRIPEVYTDVRGAVITDYQNYLEEQWVKRLEREIQTVVYKDMVRTIK